MNYNQAKKILAFGLVLLIIVMGWLAIDNWPGCSTTEIMGASIRVKDVAGKGMLGFNTDTDSLKFGVVSPGILAKRSVYVEHSEDADVTIGVKGDLAPWLTVEPLSFHLTTQEQQRVFFNANVPADAADGNYTAKVIFCFRE